MGSKKSDIAAFSAKAELEAESSARAPSGESEKSRRALRGHIARIKRAKQAAAEIFDGIKMDAAQASIEILWEAIFDRLCKNLPDTPAEIASLAAVMQRLAASRAQLVNAASKRAPARGGSAEERPCALPEDAIEKIESALNLL